MKKSYCFTLLLGGFCLITQVIYAQDSVKIWLPYGPAKAIGINTTPLLTQLIPFNRADPRTTGPFYIEWRNYGVYQGEGRYNGLKMSLGLNINPEEDIDNPRSFLAFRLAFEGRRSISPRWGYTRGFSLLFAGGNLNLPGSETGNPDAFFGFGPHWGFEYSVVPNLTLGVETSLMIGTSNFGPRLEILPPIGLFCNFWMQKRPPRPISRRTRRG